ncbi:MAG TPA: enolase C-terminal domain-like protein [Steroidobacteraceae bacterium]|nr:enolase C-terminal domain-like protein [Steroidobacteraceae bacterium]
MRAEVPVTTVSAAAYTIPTDLPEADGTAQWDSTTLVVVHVEGGGRRGFGYSYTHACAANLIDTKLAPLLIGQEAMDPPAAWRSMQRAVRNLGRGGIAGTAISAVDVALWDLKGQLLERSLADLLGCYREQVPIYGSGGFTSYTERELTQQLADWVEDTGCRWVKMKIGTQPGQDPARVAAARAAIGDSAGLFVDANGAYSLRQALQLGTRFAAEQQVSWFEEPVSSDDLHGLAQIRARAPEGMDIAAGEYGYTPQYFQRMLEAAAVDVLQADATRCGGVTGFLQAAALCEGHQVQLSAHCAPSLHCTLGCAAPRFRHIEWFHDHVRIEQMLLDGAPTPQRGVLSPDRARPGLGLTLRASDAARYAVKPQG